MSFCSRSRLSFNLVLEKNVVHSSHGRGGVYGKTFPEHPPSHTTVVWLVCYRCQGHDDLEQPVLRLKKIEKMLTSTAIRIPAFIRVY